MSTQGENLGMSVRETKVFLQVCALNNCIQGHHPTPFPVPASVIRARLSMEEIPAPPVRRHRLSTGDLEAIRCFHEEKHAKRQAERFNAIEANRNRAIQSRLILRNASNNGASTRICSNDWCPVHGSLQRREPGKGLRRHNAFYFSASFRCTAHRSSDEGSDNDNGIDSETESDSDNDKDNGSENHSRSESDNSSGCDSDSDNDPPTRLSPPVRALRKSTCFFFSASAVSHAVRRGGSDMAIESDSENDNNVHALRRLPNIDRPSLGRNAVYAESLGHSATSADERRRAFSFSRSVVDLPSLLAGDVYTTTCNTAIDSSEAVEGLQTVGQPQEIVGQPQPQQQRLTAETLGRLNEINKMNKALKTGGHVQSMEEVTEVSAMVIVKKNAVADDCDDEEDGQRRGRNFLTHVGSALRLDDMGSRRGRTIERRARSAVRHGDRKTRSTKTNTREWFVRGRGEKSEGEDFADDKMDEEKRKDFLPGQEGSSLGKTVAWWL